MNNPYDACPYRKELTRMTKAELIQECINQRDRADQNHDNYMDAREDRDLLERKEEELEEIKDLIHRLKTSRARYFLGVETEKEEIEKILDLILEIET